MKTYSAIRFLENNRCETIPLYDRGGGLMGHSRLSKRPGKARQCVTRDQLTAYLPLNNYCNISGGGGAARGFKKGAT